MRGNRGLTFCLILALCAAAQAVTIDWVTVGDAGNQGDTRSGAGRLGMGDVANAYHIGKYEVTNAQYTEFLNAKAAVGDPNGLYSGGMAGMYGGISRSGLGTLADPYIYSAKGGDANWNNRPVNFVSFWDAARFANWIQNGQGSGNTETGAYTGIGNQAAFARQPGALFFIPTEDEWYKAAYYKGGGPSAGYWEYPTKSDTAPTGQAPPGTDMVNGSANYWVGGWSDPSYYFTPVGAYMAMPSAGPYGTFDQGGNVWEWNETVIPTGSRGLRGGSCGDINPVMLSAWQRNGTDPVYEGEGVGFRLAGSLESAAVPEPATLSLLGIGLAALLRRRRRRA